MTNHALPLSSRKYSPCLERLLGVIAEEKNTDNTDALTQLLTLNHEQYADGATAGDPETPIVVCALSGCMRDRTLDLEGGDVSTADHDILNDPSLNPCIKGNPTIEIMPPAANTTPTPFDIDEPPTPPFLAA